jgi:hypothetical protein
MGAQAGLNDEVGSFITLVPLTFDRRVVQEGHQPDTGDTVVRVARLGCVQKCKVSTASRLMFLGGVFIGP